MDTQTIVEETPQLETVAKLTKQQFAKAAEIRYAKDAAFQAMQELVRTAYSLYEDRKAKLLEREQELWKELYDAFGLDPDAVYSIDNKDHTLVRHPHLPEPVISETEALTNTEADHIN